TVQGYIQGLHAHWLTEETRRRTGSAATGNFSVENRFRYNPEVQSLPAMVPTVIPLLLLMLPAMLAALAVVREKEIGSIINLYVTPVTRSEFLLGKQIPYVVLAVANFLLMVLMAVFVFGVPVKGSFVALLVAATIYCLAATGLGLLISAVTRSQIAALFLAMIATMLPATAFGGMTDPVASLEGAGRVIGEIYPASHMFTISRGVFNKALGFRELAGSFLPLALAVPVIIGVSILLVRKQER
ncbi:MAG TPA: ABC transporter permease, partial [Sphingomonas sp.]|nr:ABC transporter permease [Sphingomonas sp.]